MVGWCHVSQRSAMEYSEQAYQKQLAEKIEVTRDEFRGFGIEDIDVFESEVQNYRMRAEFRVWHDGDELYYIMFDKETRERYRVDTFPTASELINTLMPLVIEKVKVVEVLDRKLFQIDYLSSLSGEVVISLLYHKQLTDEWEEAVRALKQEFADLGYSVDFIGRARKQKRVVDREYVVEKLNVYGREYVYRQVENSFTQPNGKVAEKMLEWAVEATRGCEGDLLELYCGNGNFSVALAQNFDRVLATELAKPSVDAAQWNIAENRIENLKIARLSAEEFTQAMRGEREFRRLQQQEIDVTDYNFTTVLVDPPRAGMDLESVRMVQAYDTIVYISCNPLTLKENLDVLAETHKVERMAMFDQFPYTQHREVGVVLTRI